MKNIKRGFGLIVAVLLGCLITAAPMLLADVVRIPVVGGSISLPLGFASGGTGLTTAADDTTLVSSGSAWVAKAIPDSNSTGVALQYDTATNAFSAATLYQIKRLAADFSVTSGTAYADVTGMTFTLAANTSYSLSCYGNIASAAATTAARISLNGPASPTAVSFAQMSVLSTAVPNVTSELTAYDADTTHGSLFAGVATGFTLWGTVENGANAGTLALRLKSEVDTSQVTIKRGLFCKLF